MAYSRIYATLLVVFVCKNFIHTDAYLKCCPGENLLINSTCSDGSNLTALPCDVKYLMGPSQVSPSAIMIDEDDTLIVTDENEVGTLLVYGNNYCITKLSENGTDEAVVCDLVGVVGSPGRQITTYLQMVCAFVSALFFLVTFVIYLYLPDLQDVEGKCILNFVAPLLVAHIFLTIQNIIMYYEPKSCDLLSFLNFTAVICCYNWLSILSFHTWRITLRPIFRKQIQWFVVYMCYGYGVPAILIVTALLHHYMQNIDARTAEVDCWLSGGAAIWTYFFGPLIIMILLGIILLAWTSKKLWMDIDRRDNSQSVLRLRKKCLMYIYLMLVAGSVALLDILYSRIPSGEDEVINYLWDISDCRNLLMGTVIFCILVVMRNKVLKALAKRGLCCMKFPQSWRRLVDEEREELENDEATLTQYSSGL